MISFEILNRAAASRFESSPLSTVRTTAAMNSGEWRSFFQLMPSISCSCHALTRRQTDALSTPNRSAVRCVPLLPKRLCLITASLVLSEYLGFAIKNCTLLSWGANFWGAVKERSGSRFTAGLNQFNPAMPYQPRHLRRHIGIHKCE
ncbi:Uncharacterised protein [Salmonella enterica subsp. houtenae]|nr:Uncharacterised protein [Salmonella enterica subsp. houtenae]